MLCITKEYIIEDLLKKKSMIIKDYYVFYNKIFKKSLRFYKYLKSN